MRVVPDKPVSPILTQEYRRNLRLEFIAAHNEKIRKQKERLLSIDAPLVKSS